MGRIHKLNDGTIKITKSSMQTYVRCPKLYEYQYKKGLSIPDIPQFILGRKIHKLFDDIHVPATYKKLLKSDMDVQSYYDTLMSLMPKPLDDLEAKYYNNISVSEAKRFYRLKKDDKHKNWLPVKSEYKVETKYNGVLLSGILDALYKTDNGYMTFEYKTGKWKDYGLSSIRRETVFYKLVLERSSMPKGSITQIGWYYPLEQVVMVEKPSPYTLNSIVKIINNIKNSWNNNDFPMKDSSYTCDYCPFIEKCILEGD